MISLTHVSTRLQLKSSYLFCQYCFCFYNFFSCNFFLCITIFKIFTSQNLFPQFLRFFIKCISKSFNNSSFKCDNQLSFNLKNLNSCLILFLILEFIILFFYLLKLKSTSVFLYDLPNTNFHLR